MDPNFGDFITNEYGLLKQILSYLRKPCDLHNARLVCRKWMSAVDNLIEREPVVLSYKCGRMDPLPRRPVLPHLVIHQNIIHEKYIKTKCLFCEQGHLLSCCDLKGPETGVLMLNNLSCELPYDPELYSFWQLPSYLLLSCPENIKITPFYNNKSSSKCSSLESLADFNEEIKGVFVVCKSAHRKTAQILLNEAVEKQGPTFAVGGGIADRFSYKHHQLGGVNKECKTGGLCVIFKGDKVTAHSDLITGKNEETIDKQFTKLKERVGEVPEGSTQIAFIAQCVDRAKGDIEKLECRLFRKHFPTAHQCGFPAWGELGIKNSGSDFQVPRNKSKRRKLELSHMFTTSVMIVTLSRS